MTELYRTQVLLERQQHEYLKEMAAAERRSMSDIIREAVAEYLLEKDEASEKQQWQEDLAFHESAPLWTADRRLYNAARQAGLEWVHWVGGA